MKYISSALMGMVVMTATASNLPFIDKDFDTFLKRLVPSSVRGQFSKKYKEFQERSSTLSVAERAQQKYELFEQALDALEQDHKAWADDITAFIKDIRFLDEAYDGEGVAVREFLERYGLFKQFSKEALVHISVAKQGRARKAWENVKTQIAQATHKMSDWFKGKTNVAA